MCCVGRDAYVKRGIGPWFSLLVTRKTGTHGVSSWDVRKREPPALCWVPSALG